MCIRDRNTGVGVFGSFDELPADLGEAIPAAADSEVETGKAYIPVSYTHLDVYKRQLYTGDAALLDENGLLYIKGREDDMINKAGMNIYPQELESALLADPRVREVTAYGFRSPSGVQIGLKLAGDFGSVREVRALCRDAVSYTHLWIVNRSFALP